MTCLVTGCAGFIGSHLAERVVKDQHEVIGIDCFTDYYPRWIKEKNLQWLGRQSNFVFHEVDLLDADFDLITGSLSNSLIIFHLAAQAGVRASWGKDFEIYTENNVRATQRLLEWAKDKKFVRKFIYASSSSVYGDTDVLPMVEDSLLRPLSPYGVTKLAGEHLCNLYWKNFGVPVVSLRYFTVYGPRQRPDMAFHKFIKAILKDKEIEIYGDGEQTRDFTYIDDVVEASVSAVSATEGEIFNIGRGTRLALKDTVKILQEIMKKEVRVKYIPVQKGDVRHTVADITKARKFLKYDPKVGLESGLAKEIEWLSSYMIE
jgi:nucleoside-diphosphate-sugar epimerase